MTKTHEKTEDLEMWDNRNSFSIEHDEAILSEKGLALSGSSAGSEEKGMEISIDQKYYILAQLISQLTGKDIKLFVPGKARGGQAGSGQGNSGQEASRSEGWGVRYSSVETYTETEQAGFSAQGVVTANGKEYTFSASLLMERSYSFSESIDIRGGDALKDPLVVNFGQGPVDLSGKKMKFDIDMDGDDEDMPTLGKTSGFLTIDKNGNGIVDDGSELFGPATGDGYGELAAYDEDRNGWIDEADSVYSKLRVWSQSGESGAMQTLQDLNIGAFYTGSATTPFELKNGENETEAMIRQTSIYLREDGTVGTTQKIDVAV